MKISPLSSTGMVVGATAIGAEVPQTMAQKIRAIKMNVNVTPGRVEEPPLPEEKLSTPAVTEPAQEVVGDTQPLSPQLAAIARAKRALQVKEREIADREKALLERSSSQEGAIDRARLKSDTLGVLLEEGVTYEQLTEQILARQNGYNPEIAALKQKIEALESGIDKKLTDREAQSEQQALAEMRREASQLIAQGEDYELVRETRSLPHVMQLIEQTYRKTGEVLDVREALQLVEEELIKDGLRVAAIKKIQSQFAPAQPVLQPQQPRQMRTLTNRDTASVPLSRKARALAAFAGTLKK